MEKRRFGRTEHMSTVAIFGLAAFWQVDQETADTAVKTVMDYGVNHIDIAPSYGLAEQRLGPWMIDHRNEFFVGCKTTERSKAGAMSELHASLERLNMDYFDLYQIHAITSQEELDLALADGGAIEALVEAREKGLTRFLGITGHGVDTPAHFIEALNRFDFDTVTFPINYVQYANPKFRADAEELVRICRQRDVGTMIIKSITKGPWGDKEKIYDTWYEPFDELPQIQEGVNFVLSQDVTGLCTAGETKILPMVLEACENFQRLSIEEQEALIARGVHMEPLFA